jgi:hypothetical protein
MKRYVVRHLGREDSIKLKIERKENLRRAMKKREDSILFFLFNEKKQKTAFKQIKLKQKMELA